MVQDARGVPAPDLKNAAPALPLDDGVEAGLPLKTEGRRRGRPSSAAASQVYEALLAAAEKCLEHKRYNDITVREIAAAAQVNPAMVNYYFDGKEGLFLALVEFLFSDWSSRLRQIEAPARHDAGTPTQRFVETVRICFYQHRTVLWLIDHELRQKDSSFSEAFKAKLASQSVSAIRRFIKVMGEKGHYRQDADLRYLSYAVAALSTSPIALAPGLERSYGIRMEELSEPEWMRFLEQSMDRLLRPA